MRPMNTLLSCRAFGGLVSHIRGCKTTSFGAMPKGNVATGAWPSSSSKDTRLGQVLSRSSSTTKVSRNSVAYQPKHEEVHAEQGEWLWPVDNTQLTFIEAHRVAARHTGAFTTLNSAKPLRIEHVSEMLLHLQRKLPIYNVRAKGRDGNLWWQKRESTDIDFKVLERGMRYEDILDDIWSEGLLVDSPKPVWRARLVPAAEDAPHPMPELKAAYPYQYNFMTLTHHAVSDGFTVAFLCQLFLDLLNAVIDGQTIDDKPFGVFVSNEDIARQDRAIQEQLRNDQKRFETLKAEVLNSNKEPVLFKAFPRPSVDKPSSRQVTNCIDAEIHNRITEKSKQAGVSFGTALQASINIAIVEMVRDAGVDDEYHDISVNVAADLRRYMRRAPAPVLGLHARTMAHLTRTHKNTRDCFWDYARDLHQKLGAQIKSGGIMQQEVVRQMVMPQIHPKDYYAGSPEIIRDYGFNNIGDLTRVIPGEGKHVQMTDLLQYSQVAKFIYPMLHQLFTFRGSCKYIISYATDCLSEETAQMTSAKVMEILQHISK
ncbi:uncharacterized protein LOC119579327 [Penaeus monodon]|uniref:uncharacterized protein LOC119579327 n=1 Tax=Penaeus monodon TaxID=6687 RepID=UPI0018A7B564|nr:uncharacterized protein LOC119579327 [Penaeus monodon]XP_037783018.1 uncharacterized protein LOC119579327 [Penaeus monodon]